MKIWWILALAALPLLVISAGAEQDGWKVILRRRNGTLNFYQTWNTYLKEFGSETEEYWAGLHTLSVMTAHSKCQLNVSMAAFNGDVAQAHYSTFKVGSAALSYRLSVDGFTDGGAGDALSFHNCAMFSTYDRDNDGNPDVHCARVNVGAFWFNGAECLNTNPTGVYMWGPYNTTQPIGVMWKPFKGQFESLKELTMSIKCK